MGDTGLELTPHVKVNPEVSRPALQLALQIRDTARIAEAVAKLTAEERAVLLRALGGQFNTL